MPDAVPDNQRYDQFVLAQAKALRAKDDAPASPAEWQRRRAALRDALFAALGPIPAAPADLDPKVLGVLDRKKRGCKRR